MILSAMGPPAVFGTGKVISTSKAGLPSISIFFPEGAWRFLLGVFENLLHGSDFF